MTIKKNSVTEHNDLIKSMTRMDRTPLKIFELVVAEVDPYNPPENNQVRLSKKRLFDLFKVSSESKYTTFKNAIEKLHQQSVFRIKEGEKRGRIVYQVISPFASTKWDSDSDDISFKLTEEIMPYLFDLRENYTKMALSDMIEMNSKYSIVLYKWLTMNLNQFKNYEKTNLRNKEQLDNLQNPTISVEDFRVMTDTEDTYQRFSSLKARILQPAVDEINDKTTLKVGFETIKSAYTVTSIQFHVDRDFVAESSTYKEEQNDELAANSVEERNRIASEAMRSPFTKKLVTKQLLTALDIIDNDTMYHVAYRVFPLYEKIVQEVGQSGLDKHLDYVAEYRIDYSNKNIAKYLANAAEDYLRKIKLNASI